MIRIGRSGFSYPEWIGDFYPRGTKRDGLLAYYATRFDAVEINMSFRRDVEEATIDKWRDATPEDFRFTMKAHQRITHYKRLVDVGENVREFVERAQRLGTRLGIVLFQTRSNLAFDAEVLENFCASLHPGPTYALEARHESFATSECDEILRRHGVARCLNDDVFEPETYTVTAPVVYFRFHREKPYEPDELQMRAELVQKIASDGVDVYAFFAHEDNPESIRPALRFQELMSAS